MLNVFIPGATGLVPSAPAPNVPIPEEAIWIDLFQPTSQEIKQVEQMLGIELPTREEMQEIEVSSRLYQEDGAAFMTALILSQSDSKYPETTAVTFVLSGPHLITLRHAEPRPVRTFTLRAQHNASLKHGDAVLTGIIETVVDRAADILERITLDVDSLSHEVFKTSTPGNDKANSDFQVILRNVGHTGDLASRARDSLMTISRLLAFTTQIFPKEAKDPRNQVKILWRDVQSLLDHANFLSGKIAFLLDATLGMINIEQNSTIKIFSVVAVLFLPPTMVASIYGMNFDIMPELQWPLGYPLALLLMLLSGVLPLLYFKRKHWL